MAAALFKEACGKVPDLYNLLQLLPHAAPEGCLASARWLPDKNRGKRGLRVLLYKPEALAKSEAELEEEASDDEPTVPGKVGRAVLNGGALARQLFGAQGAELRCLACSSLAAALAPMAAGGVAMDGAMAAFCPFPFDSLTDPLLRGLGLDTGSPLWDPSLQDLEKGILVATFAQGTLGLVRICLGDVFTGAYTLLLATLGFNSRHPGPASNWLKTYVLITFINGTMGSIDIAQNALINNFPAVLPTLPLALNVMHSIQLSGPPVAFLGAYFGWQHIKLQRKVAVEAYQQQMKMLIERVPWPPPPLPFPIPGLAGQAGVPGGVPAPRLPARPCPPPCASSSCGSGRCGLQTVAEEAEAEQEPEAKEEGVSA